MIQLHDKETGKAVGAITEDQLQFLKDRLEEESAKDQDYYINEDTIDSLIYTAPLFLHMIHWYYGLYGVR